MFFGKFVTNNILFLYLKNRSNYNLLAEKIYLKISTITAAVNYLRKLNTVFFYF